MKLIEAMKEVRILLSKADDLRKLINQYCVKTSIENSTYENQAEKINEWLQSHQDSVRRISELKVKIQKTNLETMVTIDLGGNKVTHSIAEWILRRRELATLERSAWELLNDKNIKEGILTQTDGLKIEVKINRFYDPIRRDKMIAMLKSEPLMIDSSLEVINAITDLIE